MLAKFGIPFDKATPLVHFPKSLKRPRNNTGPASFTIIATVSKWKIKSNYHDTFTRYVNRSFSCGFASTICSHRNRKAAAEKLRVRAIFGFWTKSLLKLKLVNAHTFVWNVWVRTSYYGRSRRCCSWIYRKEARWTSVSKPAVYTRDPRGVECGNSWRKWL